MNIAKRIFMFHNSNFYNKKDINKIKFQHNDFFSKNPNRPLLK